ncbi:MAG: insulinase family protein, partial [Muribaculaceae bacterium]|nr:insulinase family protein [Muribaculaceae bacterium]
NPISAFEAVYRELLRAARNGFTQTEYDRVRNNYLSSFETIYNNRDKRRTATYVNEYVENFLDNSPIPSLDDEYALMKNIAKETTVDEISKAFRSLVHNDNRIVMVMAPDNGAYVIPNQQQLAESLAKVEAENIEAYVDIVNTKPFIPNLPAPGKIVSENHNDRWDATEWTLSNRVKVIVKPTEFKKEEVLFNAIALGGLGIIPDSVAPSIMLLPDALEVGGLGEFTANDLSKYLAGKRVGIGYSFGTYDRNINGSSTPRDIPTLMELIYMSFTAPALTEQEYEAFCESIKPALLNQESNPQFIFSRDVMKSTFKSPRRQPVTAETVAQADREEILDITHRMLANAADYTFIFVGSIDLDTFRPLVEQYIATLPTNKSMAIKFDGLNPDFLMKPGMTEDHFTTKMENPQTWVFLSQFGEIPFTAKNSYVSRIAGEILGNRLLAKVREEMGAVYSIGASSSVSRIGDQASIGSSFPMKPEMKQQVLEYIKQEMNNMTSDIKPEEVSKQVEFMVKNLNANRENNGTWLSSISSYVLKPVDTLNGAVEVLQAITPADIQNYMKELLKQNNYRVVTLDPEK